MMRSMETIKFCFTHYDDIKREIEAKRLDSCTPKSGGGNGHCRISDPTATKAIRNLLEVDCVCIEYGLRVGGNRELFTLHHPEAWLRVVDVTTAHFHGKLQGEIALQLRKGADYREIIAKLCVGRSVYYILLNDMLSFAEGVAVGKGLIPPKK